MQNLTRASEELFRRGPDECFATFDALWQHCQEAKARSVERWHPPTELRVEPYAGQLRLLGGDEATYRLNDWSFTQLCSLADGGMPTGFLRPAGFRTSQSWAKESLYNGPSARPRRGRLLHR